MCFYIIDRENRYADDALRRSCRKTTVSNYPYEAIPQLATGIIKHLISLAMLENSEIEIKQSCDFR